MGNNSDRKPYETAVVLDQEFLDEAQDNLTNQLEMIIEIDSPTGTLRLSDRNKYSGDAFYEARVIFPVIKRTVGDFLSPILEFDNLTIEVNNVDEKFNPILPAGVDFDGMIGRDVEVKLGLRDVSATYDTIFKGKITEEGGFSRTTGTWRIIARSEFDTVNQPFPTLVFDDATYPDIEEDKINKAIPVIYGDWNTAVETDMASIPAIPVNGKSVTVNGTTSFADNVELVISQNDNRAFDFTEVYLQRGNTVWRVPALDVVAISAGDNEFEIRQQSGTLTLIFGESTVTVLEFQLGDKFFVKVDGTDVGVAGRNENAVEIARHVLKTFGGLSAGDFDATWDTFATKSTPAESDIAGANARLWIQEPNGALNVALSMLEQVRLEGFVNRDQKFSINSLHFEDWIATPSHKVENWDVEKDTFRPTLDERNNFNRAKGVFNFLPNRNEERRETRIRKNQAAIDQIDKKISKQISFPNLTERDFVTSQVDELLKITSSNLEHVNFNSTWRGMLLDIGDFVNINVQIQSTQFLNVPAMIREIGYDPDGMKIPLRVWSFQMVPFPGHSPGFSGIVGGQTATIEDD